MTSALCKTLPSVLPKAIAWGVSQYELIMRSGSPLDDLQFAIARKKHGIVHPERIRIVEVSSLPQPEDPELLEVALDSGLFGSSMVGMAISYGIYVCRGYAGCEMLSYVFRQVRQYEDAGSISGYLRRELEYVENVEYGDAVARSNVLQRA